MSEHTHRWTRMPATFVGMASHRCLAITHSCKCGEVRAVTPYTLNENAANVAYVLERTGDTFLTDRPRDWIDKRRIFMKTQETPNAKP